VPGFVGAQVPAEIYENIANEVRSALKQARDSFEETCRKAGRNDRAEWQQVEGDPAHALAIAARCTDVIVLGQSEPEKDPSHIQALPDDLVMTAGRPILVVPYIGAPKTIGSHIVVAWANTRESTRAAMDALPLLQQAETVEIVTVNSGDRDSLPGADIARWLAEHGVEATINRFDAGVDPADAVLNHVSDSGADMIVMGAYGHSRLRETVLGGTTRSILKQMTVPVLLAH
jgi:nucleotide-binding universal stress UspA family protein